jgi:hypothetical protein
MDEKPSTDRSSGSNLVICRTTFWLTVLCLVGLVASVIVEAGWHIVLFDSYIAGFLGLAFIFAIINRITSTPRR